MVSAVAGKTQMQTELCSKAEALTPARRCERYFAARLRDVSCFKASHRRLGVAHICRPDHKTCDSCNKGSERVSAAYKGGCTHGMHGGSEDWGGIARRRRGGRVEGWREGRVSL